MSSTPNVADNGATFALPWRALGTRFLLPIVLFAIALFVAVFYAPRAHAIEPVQKLAPDLEAALKAATPPNVTWLKSNASGRYVKVLIMAVSADPVLTDLRSAVVAAGGSVYCMYQSVQGFSAMLPGTRVLQIAARPDVDYISPNRPALKTASFIEMTTGAVWVAIGDKGICLRGQCLPRTSS